MVVGSALGVVVAVAVAVAALWSTGALAPVGGGNTAGVQEFPADDILVGGRTYRFPDGSWLIDVPDGMRLRYSSTSESPTGTQHGFTDPETGSLISIEEHTGEVRRLVVGGDAAAANARLDRFEAGFRRPPGYVEPVSAQAQAAGPALSPDGIPYLRNEESFTGGRTYTIPGHEAWRIAVPTGLDGTFTTGWFTPDGFEHYVFEGDDWRISFSPTLGYTNATWEPQDGAAIAALRSTLEALVTPAGVQELQFGQTLEGGRTYRLPDGSWLIDVPDGLTLHYSSTSESPTGTRHGFTDPETDSLISIEEHTGEINRFVQEFVVGDDAVAANARLDRFEASFRRAPGYVAPLRTSVQRSARLNADGIPILEPGHRGGIVVEGGSRYALPIPHDSLVVEIPTGLTGRFLVLYANGSPYYWFEGDGWRAYVNVATGTVLGQGSGSTAAPAEQLKAALTKLFESASTSD